MNTTAKGDAYENKVFKLVKKLIDDGTLATGKHYSVHQKQSYPIDFGTDSFIADISIETRNPHFNNEISNLIIFECKDLKRKLDKSDFEEWRGRLKNSPCNTKLYFVTRTGFTQPVIDKAMQQGIGLIVWSGEGEEKWIATRTLNELERQNLNFDLLRGNNSASFYPLIYDNHIFQTFGEMLRLNKIPIKVPTLKPAYLRREKICDIVNRLLRNPDFYSVKVDQNEDKLISFLRVKVDFQDLPQTQNGMYDATNHCIIMPNWLINHHHRLRFSLAHELGHAYLHRERLKQYESFFSPSICPTYNPPESEFHLFDVQANNFASYLLMPDWQFKDCVIKQFKLNNLHRFPFIIDNQKGKFPIYYSIVNALSTQFDVSKSHVTSRLCKDGMIVFAQQPNRIGNILRGY